MQLSATFLACNRRNLNDIMTVMFYDDSDDSSSSDEDDLDLLLFDFLFPLKTGGDNVPKLNLKDVSEDQCERMFRLLMTFTIASVICLIL
ncbi:uncharacterized protein LOC144661419 isoform X2 [Oculina patagonica]